MNKGFLLKLSGIIILSVSIISCTGDRKKISESGFQRIDGDILGYYDSQNYNLGDNCPVTDFKASNGALLLPEVFWPYEFRYVELKADGNGYYLTYDDLEVLGIYGSNPCNTMAAMYGVNSSGQYTQSGILYTYYENDGNIVTDDCQKFIKNKAYWAIITEDSYYYDSCLIEFVQ